MINLPESFKQLLARALPEEEVRGLTAALTDPVPVSIRLNPAKSEAALLPEGAVQVPWCPDAYFLDKRPLFAIDPDFHAGLYYVQEASSMLSGEIVRTLLGGLDAEATVLDLCGAPGGKSTHIASVLRKGDILVANEVIGQRTAILQENLSKWGLANHLITRADAAVFGKARTMFDIIVADMPCSGEGMFRKDHGAIDEWSPANVQLCADRQMRIAADIWPALKPGGYFIYSTCTYNRAENEENIERICRDLGAEIVIPDLPALAAFYCAEPGMYRALPHRTPGEGFFIAVLQKTGGTSHEHRTKSAGIVMASPAYMDLWPEDLLVFEHNKGLSGIRGVHTDRLAGLLAGLPGLYAAGTPVGKVFHGELKPDPALALLSGINDSSWPVIKSDNDMVLRFLRRDPLANPGLLKGIHRLTWKGSSLGWLNGNRHQWNNLWPMEWRLRMETQGIVPVLGRRV